LKISQYFDDIVHSGVLDDISMNKRFENIL